MENKRLMTLLYSLIGLAVLWLVARFWLVPATSPQPDNLGVSDNQLAPCPDSPNCVSSQAAADDSHYIAPLTFTGSATDARAALLAALEATPRTTIVTAEQNYIYATNRTLMMGFIDDVEFLIDPAANIIHVRSAARLGQSDIGVNRNRIEDIRQQLAGI